MTSSWEEEGRRKGGGGGEGGETCDVHGAGHVGLAGADQDPCLVCGPVCCKEASRDEQGLQRACQRTWLPPHKAQQRKRKNVGKGKKERRYRCSMWDGSMAGQRAGRARALTSKGPAFFEAALTFLMSAANLPSTSPTTRLACHEREQDQFSCAWLLWLPFVHFLGHCRE